jgi:hypothetical protein
VAYSPVGVIFSDNFDDQPDWTATMHSSARVQRSSEGDTLPAGWESTYQQSNYLPSVEILSSNADKAKGGVGKSAVHWRQSIVGSPSQWRGDSQVFKSFPPTPSLYIEFYIAFDDNWYSRANVANWSSKVFRCGSWDGVSSEFSGFQGGLGPLMLWDYKKDLYGVRNVVSFRGGPWGENYVKNDNSFNYTLSTVGQAPGGTTPELLDKVNGGFISDDINQTASHDQVFGPDKSHWTKVAFYMEMNSAPGVADGVFKQWLDGERILNRDNRVWVGNNTENKMVGWNFVSMGGNHHFYPYPDSDEYRDWYALDDLLIMDRFPENLE